MTLVALASVIKLIGAGALIRVEALINKNILEAGRLLFGRRALNRIITMCWF